MLRKYLDRQLEDFSILRKSKKSKSEKESQEEPDQVSHRHDRCVSHQVVLVPGQEIIISFVDSFCLFGLLLIVAGECGEGSKAKLEGKYHLKMTPENYNFGIHVIVFILSSL